jgi:hypothetical protein
MRPYLKKKKKNPSLKRAGGVAQGGALSSKPQYCKKKKKSYLHFITLVIRSLKFREIARCGRFRTEITLPAPGSVVFRLHSGDSKMPNGL